MSASGTVQYWMTLGMFLMHIEINVWLSCGDSHGTAPIVGGIIIVGDVYEELEETDHEEPI